MYATGRFTVRTITLAAAVDMTINADVATMARRTEGG